MSFTSRPFFGLRTGPRAHVTQVLDFAAQSALGGFGVFLLEVRIRFRHGRRGCPVCFQAIIERLVIGLAFLRKLSPRGFLFRDGPRFERNRARGAERVDISGKPFDRRGDLDHHDLERLELVHQVGECSHQIAAPLLQFAVPGHVRRLGVGALQRVGVGIDGNHQRIVEYFPAHHLQVVGVTRKGIEHLAGGAHRRLVSAHDAARRLQRDIRACLNLFLLGELLRGYLELLGQLLVGLLEVNVDAHRAQHLGLAGLDAVDQPRERFR